MKLVRNELPVKHEPLRCDEPGLHRNGSPERSEEPHPRDRRDGGDPFARTIGHYYRTKTSSYECPLPSASGRCLSENSGHHPLAVEEHTHTLAQYVNQLQ